MTFKVPVKRALTAVLGAQWVKDDPVTLYAYRCDGLTLHTGKPMGVVFPADTNQLVDTVRILHQHQITFLPRGAGTGLSGGAIPGEGSVVVEMCRFKTIHEVDYLNRTVTVGPGVVNALVSKTVADQGFRFIPDPSSQKACTIGGNIGENSGGPHTLKYGVTVNHVLSLEVVLPDGELITLGDTAFGQPGPDLLALFIGSEGTLGIVTKAVCRICPAPEKVVTLLAVFQNVTDACHAVSAMIRSGTIPAALEMIDNVVVRAVESCIGAGFPLDAGAVLIIELEDLAQGLEQTAAEIEALCRRFAAADVRRARDDAERAVIWRARKEAIGAIGTISPSFYIQDGVIPRSKLPDVLAKIPEICNRYGLVVGNVFHAGDGNLHPLILYNSRDPKEVHDVFEAGREILELCLSMGGTLSGEHGIGLEKSHMIEQVCNPDDLDAMKALRNLFNPNDRLNPGKIFPTPGKCSEAKIVAAKSGIAV